MPVVRVRPRTPQEREDAHFHQLRFGRYVPPKASPSVVRAAETAARPVPLIAAFRDLLAGVRRETSPFTVAATWVRSPASSAPSLPPLASPAPPPPVVDAPAPTRPPLMLLGE